MTSWVQGRVSILHSDVLTGFMPNITVSGSGCPTDKDQAIELLVDQSAELTYDRQAHAGQKSTDSRLRRILKKSVRSFDPRIAQHRLTR